MKAKGVAMKYVNLLFVILTLLSITTSIYAEGLSTLANVGKSQDAMQRALNKETKSFEKIKKAIEKGTIKKGDRKDTIRKHYGEPVVILPDKQYAEKWVYKPGYASWFNGIKIYLFFDSNNELEGIKEMSK